MRGTGTSTRLLRAAKPLSQGMVPWPEVVNGEAHNAVARIERTEKGLLSHLEGDDLVPPGLRPDEFRVLLIKLEQSRRELRELEEVAVLAKPLGFTATIRTRDRLGGIRHGYLVRLMM